MTSRCRVAKTEGGGDKGGTRGRGGALLGLQSFRTSYMEGGGGGGGIKRGAEVEEIRAEKEKVEEKRKRETESAGNACVGYQEGGGEE